MPSVWRIYNNEIGENRAKISNNNVILASERVCYRDIKKKRRFYFPVCPNENQGNLHQDVNNWDQTDAALH